MQRAIEAALAAPRPTPAIAMVTVCVNVVAEYPVEVTTAPALHMVAVLARRTPLISKKDDDKGNVPPVAVPLAARPRSKLSRNVVPSALIV